MTTEKLPDPPIPAAIDLRTFDDMPLDVRALRDSDTAAEVTDQAFRAAVMLWCSAWHQIPAASLPNDDRKLAGLAGYGRDMRGWKRVRTQALRGFQLCSDGRLYHLYMCEKAIKAWKLKNVNTGKANGRWNKPNHLNNNETADTAGKPPQSTGKTTAQPPQSPGISHGNAKSREDISSPLPPPSHGAGSGSLEAPPDRPSMSTASPPADTRDVEVTMPTGARIRITAWGAVDEVWTPRDCLQTALTRKEALELRAKALGQTADTELSHQGAA